MAFNNSESQIAAIMSGRKTGLFASAARAVLAMIEPIYSRAVGCRNTMFDVGLRKVHRAPRPVISIGNLTTGGTGKTPVVAWLVRNLLDRGHRPAVLMRGYKSVAGISDEANLLRQLLPTVPVISQSDRVAAARAAIESDSSLDCFVLDDGFQHRRLARELDIVLIDATEPFGFGHVLPRGMLREPIRGLRRCDCVIITRCESVSEAALDSIMSHLRAVVTDLPILHCFMTLDHFLDEKDQRQPIERCDGIYAVCGIGNPRNFFEQLRRQCGQLVGERSYPDHFAYSPLELLEIVREARSFNARQIVTTEKDWTKLAKLRAKTASNIPIWRAVLRIEFGGDDAGLLMEFASSRLAGGPCPPRDRDAAIDAAGEARRLNK